MRKPGRRSDVIRCLACAGFPAVMFLMACRGGETAGSASPASSPSSPAAGDLQAADVRIRVRLAADVEWFELAIDGPCEMRDAFGAAVAVEAPLSPRRITGEILRPPVTPASAPGADGPLLEVRPRKDGDLRLRLPGMETFQAYRGVLRCDVGRSGRIELVNELGVEDYLRSVVAREMPTSFHREALRAQAIIARTYALWLRQTDGERRAWDVKAGEGGQVYAGIREDTAAAEAVEATRGIVCTWKTPVGPKIFCTYYSAVCGGCTQAARNIANEGDIPPLSGGVSCDYCAGAKHYRWGPERVSRKAITAGLRERSPRCADLGRVQTVEAIETTPDGRPVRIRVVDEANREVVLRAEEFRLAVDPTGRLLKSTFFTLRMEPDYVVFADGRGYGHGVGLCQWGAEGLARRGRVAGEILAYYYPGCRLTLAYR